MLQKVVNSKKKNGKQIFGVLYKDDPNREVHFLTKEEIISQKNGEELLSNFHNEKKKIRNIEKIYGFVMPPGCGWLFAVKFKDSDKIDLVTRKDLKKHNIDALLQFYESHMDFLRDKMETVNQKQKSSKSSQKSHNDQSPSNSPNNKLPQQHEHHHRHHHQK